MHPNIERAMKIEENIKLLNERDKASFLNVLRGLGFASIEDYNSTKQRYLLASWIPEVYRVDISEYAAVTEDAIINGKYGIYISNGDGVHAYHGNQPIDYELCETLGVRVVELGYEGGTILGSAADLSVILVAPADIGYTHEMIIGKYLEVISKYVPGTTVDGNDILVDGNKVCGSMTRTVGNSYVWAAQVSFADYSEYITQICNKPPIKTPSFIDSELLTRDELEKEIVSWLRKEITE